MAIQVDVGINALFRSVDRILKARDVKRKAQVNNLINSLEAVGSIVETVDELYMALLRKAEKIVESPQPSRADLDELMDEGATFLHQPRLMNQMITLGSGIHAAVAIKPFDRGLIGRSLPALDHQISTYVARFIRLQHDAGTVTYDRYPNPYDLNDVLYRLGSLIKGGDSSRSHATTPGRVVAQAIENADPEGSIAIHGGIGQARQQLVAL